MGALDPTLPVGRQIVEKLRAVMPEVSRREAQARGIALLDALRIPSAPARFRKYRPEACLMEGEPTSPIDLSRGCAFRSRCPQALEACATHPPVPHRVRRARLRRLSPRARRRPLPRQR